MTSRSLYSKLMREDLKSRLWAIALIGLGCFFVFPVPSAFMAGVVKEYQDAAVGLRIYTRDLTQWLSFENGGTAFGMMVASLICGFSGFSYLNSRSKVDFYHSIPVRREKLYLVKLVNGILILALPYVISVVAAVIIGIGNGVDGGKLWPVALAGCGLHLTYFILMYVVVILAALLTGNLVVGILGSLVLTFYLPLAVSVIQAYYGSFFENHVYHENGISEKLMQASPVIQYIIRINEYNVEKPVLMAALGALAASAVLAVIGCMLYRKRPSEAAGRAMAFPKTRSVIRILLTMLSALGFALFFWGVRESTGWCVFGVICGGVICHCVIEIIYHFDFKKLFSHKGQLVGCVMASLAVMLVFRYDLTGYDRYLPSAGDVKNVAVYMDALSGWISYGHTEQQKDGTYQWRWTTAEKLMEDQWTSTAQTQDVENLLAIAAEGIAQTEQRKQEQSEPQQVVYDAAGDDGDFVVEDTKEAYADNPASPLEWNQYVTVCYTLNSGRKVMRRYYMALNPVRSQVEQLYSSEYYQNGTFPVLNRTTDRVANIRYREHETEICISDLNESQKKEFLETYQQEFRTMTLQKMEEEYPVGLIRFTLPEDEAAIRWTQSVPEAEKDYRYYRMDSEFVRRDFYPVYPSFVKTIALLKANGAEVGSYRLDDLVGSVSVCTPLKDGDQDVFGITDPQQVKELLQQSVDGGLSYYSPMSRLEATYLELTYKEENALTRTYDTQAKFLKGKLPTRIKEQLDERLDHNTQR